MKKVLTISGYKNSGKTTLITKLIPLLEEKGIHVSLIKHDGHVFDTPNSDTDRYHKAGCKDICIYDEEKAMYIQYKPLSIEDIIESMEGDLIIIEGLKESHFHQLFIDQNNVIPSFERGIYSRDDIEGIADCIVEFASNFTFE